MAAFTAPSAVATGDAATASWANLVAAALLILSTGTYKRQTLVFTPGGDTPTPGSGSATWLTLGNVTVPTWATACDVTYTLNGIYDAGTTSNVAAVIKVGSVSGTSHRLLAPGVANQRFHMPVNDTLTGLSTGTQSVTFLAAFTAGSLIHADATSFVTATFSFTG